MKVDVASRSLKLNPMIWREINVLINLKDLRFVSNILNIFDNKRFDWEVDWKIFLNVDDTIRVLFAKLRL